MKRTALITFVLSLGVTAGMAQAQYYQQQGPPPPQGGYGQGGYGQRGYGGQGGWDATPPEFAGIRQRGFRDGIEGARRDFDNHRPPNVNNRDEFRNPRFIPGPDRREYKMAFRRGYDVGVRHMYGGGPRGPRGPRPY